MKTVLYPGQLLKFKGKAALVVALFTNYKPGIYIKDNSNVILPDDIVMHIEERHISFSSVPNATEFPQTLSVYLLGDRLVYLDRAHLKAI